MTPACAGSNPAIPAMKKGKKMIKKNVVKKCFEVNLENDIGETCKLRIDAETETSARLRCQRDGWHVLSISEVKR